MDQRRNVSGNMDKRFPMDDGSSRKINSETGNMVYSNFASPHIASPINVIPIGGNLSNEKKIEPPGKIVLCYCGKIARHAFSPKNNQNCYFGGDFNKETQLSCCSFFLLESQVSDYLNVLKMYNEQNVLQKFLEIQTALRVLHTRLDKLDDMQNLIHNLIPFLQQKNIVSGDELHS